MLHGADGSRRAVFDLLRDHLWQCDISSAALILWGMGIQMGHYPTPASVADRGG